MSAKWDAIERDWWLEPISSCLRESAVRAIESGDVLRFLGSASNEASLALVYYNTSQLQQRGLYERALLDAFRATRTNNSEWLGELPDMFDQANHERLREAGDLLPGDGPFTLYRGVAGHRGRCVRGWSWTGDIEVAKWFALRFNAPKPAVHRTVVEANDVLAYTNERRESEFIIHPWSIQRPKLVWTGDYDSAEVRELLQKREAEFSKRP